MQRCHWVNQDPLYHHYHDTEWGVPSKNPDYLFEMLILESFQAGLSWKLRSEEHTSELQSRGHLVCRLLLEKKKKNLNTLHLRKRHLSTYNKISYITHKRY